MATTSATPVDQKVRNEIKDKLRVNMCVEAGAGTGKTTSLVNRIVELLATSTTDADHIGVITFTEKAAAEAPRRESASVLSERSPRRRIPVVMSSSPMPFVRSIAHASRRSTRSPRMSCASDRSRLGSILSTRS